MQFLGLLHQKLKGPWKVVKQVRRDGKTVEALLAIVGSVIDIILSDLGKTVEFVVKNTWDFIVVIVGSIGISLIQNFKDQKIHRWIIFNAP